MIELFAALILGLVFYVAFLFRNDAEIRRESEALREEWGHDPDYNFTDLDHP